MYKPQDVALECEELGLKPEDYGEDESIYEVGIFADCWNSVMVFEALSSQWRVSFAGATGLDYQAIPVVLNLKGIKKNQHEKIFNDIRVMERAALKLMEKKHGK